MLVAAMDSAPHPAGPAVNAATAGTAVPHAPSPVPPQTYGLPARSPGEAGASALPETAGASWAAEDSALT